MSRTPRILVLALGNELAGDDAVGLEIARGLQPHVPAGVDVVLSGEAGLALLDHVTGYSHLLVIDAFVTDSHPEGSVLIFCQEQLRPVDRLAPHYAGLPDLARVAETYGIPFPGTVLALAVAIRQPTQLSAGLSASVRECIPGAVQQALQILRMWLEDAQASE